MTTPFWQIRNRDFLTQKPGMKGTQDNCLVDLKRDLLIIHFNGKPLLDIIY